MVKKAIQRAKKATKRTIGEGDAKALPKFSLFFFDRPKLTAAIFAVVLVFGIVSYTTLLKREGFPSIDFPVTSINGAYFVNDPKKVDQQVAKPISEAALQIDGVSSVNAQSSDNFFNIFISYDEGVDAKAAAAQLEAKVKEQNLLPTQAVAQFSVPYFGVTGPSVEKIDIALSFYGTEGQTTKEISEEAEIYAQKLKEKNLPLVADVFVLSPFEQAQDPTTGQIAEVQKSFDRFGVREDVGGAPQNNYYDSVIIAISQVDGADLLKLDEEVRDAVRELNQEDEFSGYSAFVSGSFAPDIEENISELQRELVIALIAILIVGSFVIAVRASIITVLSMVSVIFAVIGLLYLTGYTLNVITLFALILSLALIVDDTIIMIEAIDAQRRKRKDARSAVEHATRKISRAMTSATATAVLSFAPLLFVGGILGSFIKAIPVTVISALTISLLVSLIFIPFFARYILLRKKNMGEDGVVELAAGVESRIAKFIAKPMLWAKGSSKRLLFVGSSAVLVGFAFIVVGGFIATKVSFNIFPPSKDSNDIQISLTFGPGTDIQKAQTITDEANKTIADVLAENLNFASYYNSGNERGATQNVRLISYNDRQIRSPQIVEQVQQRLDETLTEAKANVAQVDAGPPGQAFTVAIETDDLDSAYKLAEDINEFMSGKQLTRPSGEVANVTDVSVSNPSQVLRVDGKQRVTVAIEFDGTDTSTLFVLAQSEIEKEFTDEKIKTYGLDPSAVVFDLGQESENQESFAALLIAFPLLLLAIYILLTTQFRSLLQPLLIFLAIPFSFFGISLSLYFTENPFSFFAMLGFFALIGLSIKNTILLTDYANQARRAGLGPVDAMVEALGERFRPLIATSFTAVVALIPLSIISPFWQGLAVLIIFGLLSSTLLVLTVFPYYYLAAEFLRMRVNRRTGIVWFIGLILVIVTSSLIIPKLVGLTILVYVAASIYALVKPRAKKGAK